MSFFNLNLNKIVEQWPKIAVRKPRMLAVLKALVKPLTITYQTFMLKRRLHLLLASTTPQVCKLEYLLNELFDSDQRRIYISGPEVMPKTYVWPEDDPRASYVWPANNANAAYVFSGYKNSWDFSVNIPAGMASKTDLRNILNRYKLPSKTYILKII